MTRITGIWPYCGMLCTRLCSLPTTIPAETLRINQQLESDYSGYTGLVLRHALRKYGLGQGDSIEWAGHLLTVCRKGLNWQLLVDGRHVSGAGAMDVPASLAGRCRHAGAAQSPLLAWN